MTSADNQTQPNDQIDPNVGTVRNSSDAAAGENLSVPNSSRTESVLQDAINIGRGFCMGAADTVPGVSGGTVALILGHYERLVTAISRVNSESLSLVFRGKFDRAFAHLDGRFLCGIGAGILTGIVTLAGLMHWLLDHRMPETFAVFFGLIISSVLIVQKSISRWTIGSIVSLTLGIMAAVIVGRLSPTGGGDSLVYMFGSASIAICAMILPGISGAFILLLLGVYHPITGMIKDLAKGSFDASSLTTMFVFASGCLFGLLAFSRVLHWLLDHYKDITMAGLIGLMIGSVEKLWPLQMPTPETASLKMKERVMQYIPPGEWPGNLLTLVLLAIIAAVGVLVLERIAVPSKSFIQDGSDG